MSDKKTLILGASTKESRYSNIAIKRLLSAEYEVVAIGNRPGVVGEVTIETDLPKYEAIDTVSLYLNPSRQVAYYEYIISLGPKRVIFNPGTENFEFINLLKQHGIESQLACTLVLLATDQY